MLCNRCKRPAILRRHIDNNNNKAISVVIIPRNVQSDFGSKLISFLLTKKVKCTVVGLMSSSVHQAKTDLNITDVLGVEFTITSTSIFCQ